MVFDQNALTRDEVLKLEGNQVLPEKERVDVCAFAGEPKAFAIKPLNKRKNQNEIIYEFPSSYKSVDNKAFYLSSITEFVVEGDGLESVGYMAFANCENLRSVVLPKSVKCIHDRAFGNCLTLRELVIPGELEYIGDSIFNRCPNIDAVVLNIKQKDLADSIYKQCKQVLRTVKLVDDDGNVVDEREYKRYARDSFERRDRAFRR